MFQYNFAGKDNWFGSYIQNRKDSNIRLIIYKGRAFIKGYGPYFAVAKTRALEILAEWGYAKSFIDCVYWDIRS